MNPRNPNIPDRPYDASADDGLPPLERLHELLADRALFGLAPEEAAELETLLTLVTPAQRDDLDLLAADLARSYLPAVLEPLPDHLATKVLRQAKDAVRPAATLSKPTLSKPTASEPTASEPTASEPMVEPLASVEPPRGTQAAEDASRRRWFLNTLTALAGGMLVAVSLGRQMLPSPPASPAQRRKALLAADDLQQIAWTATGDAASKGATGDVVWSPAAQEGYMTFRGLAANDPTREQYQLWVFDAARDERYPVDGGVFDVPPGGAEVVVPIDVRLPVKKATLFAITVERPGGVVVSDRSRLPLVAKAPAG